MLGLHLFNFDKLSIPIEDHSVIAIRNMSGFIFIAIIIVQQLLTIAVSSDLNTQQVFSSSELPLDVEIFSNYTFERMVQPEECSYSNLTKCHINEGLHNDYHLQCYKDVCRRKHYYCLDKPNDNTVHICGKADKCDKRKRSIAVIIPNDLNQVHVCSIACQPGYAQVNGVNCFSPCVKDDSIIVRATTETDGKRALARCHAEEGYCNANRTTYFEIGSSEDECVVADDDLGIRCEKGEELMPDCSCVEKCESTDERDWNDSLMCKPKEKNAVTMTDHAFSATNTIVKTYTEITPKKEEVSFVSANEEKSEAIQNNFKEKTEININHSSESGVTVTILAVVAVVAIISGIVGSVVYVAIQRHRKGKEDSPRQDPEAQGGDQTTDQRHPAYEKNMVINNNKTENNPIRIRGKEINVNIMHPSLERLLPKQGDIMKTHSKASDRPAHEHSDEEPMMQLLKIPQDDSGIDIEDETTARKTVRQCN
ncbi:uncharacterized protein LOC132738859 isoform X2 [Ruditapes philippinarum]|uniref:uncharacterized protein LOC132738859 isoform X2 n=1 Tax=Ruditapes philippinarum TaxID=129788 RepID=UPI00295C282D|nr:uncharacterized protein LOC132738859 isoform X2 [Ruditapes philippinarum]